MPLLLCQRQNCIFLNKIRRCVLLPRTLLSELLWGVCLNVLLSKWVSYRSEWFPDNAACSGVTQPTLELLPCWIEPTRAAPYLFSSHSLGWLSWENGLWLVQGWCLAALVPWCHPPLLTLVVMPSSEPPGQPVQPTGTVLWWHRAVTLAGDVCLKPYPELKEALSWQV